ncbi:MAG: ParB/RepB/Spo0J family partition protein [Gammaproteobacteria bacterium]|nr:ParB/RepB/Spo0J family partition protein [Gammaproteobacteria bacterium]MDH5730177.1 ParB/RepB/Spo0J family partition protein [Gammaproteobacteria bacterium]
MSQTIDNIPRIKDLPVHHIKPGHLSFRSSYQNLDELAKSITDSGLGVIQPIIVRSISEDLYEIIAGERRWRAVQLAQLSTIPAIVRDVSDTEATLIGLSDNIHHEELTICEIGQTIKYLYTEHQLKQEEIANRLGKNRTFVTRSLKVLSLPENIQTLINERKIDSSQAIELSSIQSLSVLNMLVKRILKFGMTTKLLRAEIKALDKPFERQRRDPHIVKVESELSELLGSPTFLEFSQNGSVNISIKCDNLDIFDGVMELIKAGESRRKDKYLRLASQKKSANNKQGSH